MQLRSDELKIKALKNYALTCKYKEWVALELFTLLMEQNRLGAPERRFLDHLLKKYKINYLDWAFKTHWVRDQITSKAISKKENKGQMHFSFAHEIADRINESRKNYSLSLNCFPHTLFKLPKQLLNISI